MLCVSGQLKSNNSQLMEEAAQALQNFAQQCSDPSAVQDVVQHLFKILSGTGRLLEAPAARYYVIVLIIWFWFRVRGEAHHRRPEDERVVR